MTDELHLRWLLGPVHSGPDKKPGAPAEGPGRGTGGISSHATPDSRTDPRTSRRFIVTPGAAADRYLDELGRNGRAASTRHRYRIYLYLLAEMYPYVDVDDLTGEMWRKWVDRICKGIRGQSLDVDTISQRMGIAKSFSRWLHDEELIPDDPLKRMKVPRRKDPIENDAIVWVSTEEAQRMLEVAARDINLYTDPADRFRKILCLGLLAYTGSRRAAVADARIGDVENLLGEKPTITFREKGGKRKLIKKPLNNNLAALIREASLAGVWNEPNDYLVPPRSTTWAAKRDSKVIWHLVKEVARDAGVTAHVHALRAAFAVIFLEAKPDHLWQLQQLLGHSSQDTTRVYLRRANRHKGMEAVLDLDWGVPLTATTFQGNPLTEKEGFEPSFEASEAGETE